MIFFKKIPLLIWILVIVGTLLSSFTMIRSGTVVDKGISFWGPNGHDAIWHLGVISEISKRVPPANPVFSGTFLQNYHWGFDLFASFLSYIFKLDILDVYFRILPILLGLSLGIISFFIIKKTINKTETAFWFIFLNFFAGSFGWIVTLIRDGKIGGESMFWSMQSISTFLNPPFAASLVILLLGIYFWSVKRQKNSILWAIFIGLIFGVLSGIKVYSGILIGLSISFFWLFKFIKKESNRFDFIIVLTSAFSSVLVLFLLGVLQGGSLLLFQPFWFTHSMIESVDKFYLSRLASLRFNLSQLSFSYKTFVLWAIEFFLVLVFLIGNLGTRICAFWSIFKKIINKKITDFDLLIIFLMFFSFLIPMFFVQKGTAWNTIQFFYYFLFFCNYYFALFLSDIKRNLIKIILVFLILPTTFSTLKDYFGNPAPANIPSYELEALSFLKQQKDGFVLTYPYDKDKKYQLKISTPIPLYLYETTAYVSAFSRKQTFLEDEMNLDITGFNWKKRREESIKFFNQKNKFEDRGFLLNNKIDYIYLTGYQKNISLSLDSMSLKKIFDNSDVIIYQVQK